MSTTARPRLPNLPPPHHRLDPAQRRPRAWVFVHRLVQRVLVDPVRDGWVRPRTWPEGLRGIGVLACIAYGLLLLTMLLAGRLRQISPLVPASGGVAPSLAYPILFWALLLAMSMLVTAALHAAWPIRVAVLLLVCSMIIALVGLTWLVRFAIVFPVLSCLGLIVFAIVRARKGYRFSEFVVVVVLLALGTVVPLAILQYSGAGFKDLRPELFELMMIDVSVATLPVLLVAGYTLSQFAITIASSGVAAARTTFPRIWHKPFGVLVLAAALVLPVRTALDGDFDLVPFLLGLAAVGFTLALAYLYSRAARRPGHRRPAAPAPEILDEFWAPWLYPVAIAVLIPSVLQVAIILLEIVLPLVGAPDAGSLLLELLSHGITQALFKLALAAVAIVLGWRHARAGDRATPPLMAGMAVVLISAATSTLPIPSWDLDPTALVQACLALGIAVLAVLLMRRRLAGDRAAALATLFLVSALYPFRKWPGDALGVVVGSASYAALMVGLIWRLLSDGGYTLRGSSALPRPARILIHLANLMLALLAVSYSITVRTVNSTFSPDRLGNDGDALVGRPLLLATVAACVMIALGPDERELTDRRLEVGALNQRAPAA